MPSKEGIMVIMFLMQASFYSIIVFRINFLFTFAD